MQLNTVDLYDTQRSNIAAFAVMLILKICIAGLFFLGFLFTNKNKRSYRNNFTVELVSFNPFKNFYKNTLGLL